MIKDEEHLKSKASYCLDLAKKLGSTDASVTVGNSISETVSFRNKILDESNLRINKNPNATQKFIFIPNLAIKVDVSAEKKHSSNAFSSNIYTIKLTHNNYEWEVLRTYKDLRDNHKILAKIVCMLSKFNTIQSIIRYSILVVLLIHQPFEIISNNIHFF